MWIAVLAAWKQPAVGGVLFLVFATASVWFFHTYTEPATFLVVTLPLIILGTLFVRKK